MTFDTDKIFRYQLQQDINRQIYKQTKIYFVSRILVRNTLRDYWKW